MWLNERRPDGLTFPLTTDHTPLTWLRTAIVAVLALAASATAQAQDAEQVKAGAALFAQHCQTCHGTRMRNPQWATDLRMFPKDGRSRFVDSVTYGKRQMPPWEDVLSPANVDQLWAYVSNGDP